jgi:hypothetical protein
MKIQELNRMLNMNNSDNYNFCFALGSSHS